MTLPPFLAAQMQQGLSARPFIHHEWPLISSFEVTELDQTPLVVPVQCPMPKLNSRATRLSACPLNHRDQALHMSNTVITKTTTESRGHLQPSSLRELTHTEPALRNAICHLHEVLGQQAAPNLALYLE